MSGSEVTLINYLRSDPSIEAHVVAPNGAFLDACRREGLAAYRSWGLGELHRASRRTWPMRMLVRMAASFGEITAHVLIRRPDIVQANNFAAGIYSIPPARLLGRPVVWHIHDIFPRGSLESRVLRMLSPAASRIVAVSQAVKQQITSLGVPPAKVHVIFNGVDALHRFNPSSYPRGAVRRDLALSRRHLVIGTVGQLVAAKGVHVLLCAVEAVADQIPRDVKVVVVGDPPRGQQEYKQQLLDYVNDRPPLKERTLFAGWRDDIPNVMSDFDVLVHPSLGPDSLPTAVLEAMAMEKVVIASRVGGVPEIIENSHTGLLVAPGDADDLADKLLWTIQNIQRLQPLRSRARSKVLSQFSPGQKQRSMGQLYDAVLARAGA